METCQDLDLQLNFYRWAKQDALKELASDFKTLELIKSSTAMSALAYIKSRSEDYQFKLMNSLVKGVTLPAILELAGDSLIEEDLVRRKVFNHYVLTHPITFDSQEQALVPSNGIAKKFRGKG